MNRNSKKMKLFAWLILWPCIVYLAGPQSVLALPTGYTVESGAATFEEAGNTLTITADDKTIINFEYFSIAENETVQFLQPSQVSSVLANVVGPGQSQIMGNLLANGMLVLINQNGIFFSETANVSVGSLIASTLPLDQNMYLNGEYSFQKNAGFDPAKIVNEGTLAAHEGGNLVLISESIVNKGLLQADLGTVQLATGEAATLSFDENNLISLVITKGVKEQILNEQEELEPLIKNEGTIQSNGGKIVLNAELLDNTLNTLVNTTGIIEANRFVEKNGVIEIVANGGVDIASAKAADGIITITSHGLSEVGNILSSSLELTAANADTVLTLKDGSVITLTEDLVIGENIELRAGTSTIDISGDWFNNGIFVGEESTVTFSNPNFIGEKGDPAIETGTDVSEHFIYGDNAFGYFSATDPNTYIYFEEGKTQTIEKGMTVQGAYNEHVRLLSQNDGERWQFYAESNDLLDITYAWVKDAYNLNNAFDVYMTKSTNRGNSINWDPIITWTDGDGGNSNWSDGDNWDAGGATPAEGDDVIFDGTSDTDSAIDAGFGGTIGSLSMNAGYNSTITQERSLLISVVSGRSGDFTLNSGTFSQGANTLQAHRDYIQNGGTFTGGSSSITFNTMDINAGTFTSTSGTLGIIGNTVDFTGTGTFNHNSGTLSFTHIVPGVTITDGGHNWYNVAFNGGGGGFSFADSTVIENDLTVNFGTLSGTNDITVNGGDVTGNGDINLTGGTFLLDGAGNFGGNTDWDFNNLTFGDGAGATGTTKTGTGNIGVTGTLTVAANQSFSSSDDTYTLSGTTGTPLVISGTLAADTSTYIFSGNNAGGNTTIPDDSGFYNLTLNNADETFTAAGAFTVNNDLTLTSGTYLPGQNVVVNNDLIINGATLTLGTNGLTVLNNLDFNSGTLNASSNLLTVDGNIDFTGTGTFNANGGTVVIRDTTNLTSAGETFNQINVGTGIGTSNLTIQDDLAVDFLNFPVGSTNNLTINAGLNVTYSGSSLDLSGVNTGNFGAGSKLTFINTTGNGTTLNGGGFTLPNIQIGNASSGGILTFTVGAVPTVSESFTFGTSGTTTLNTMGQLLNLGLPNGTTFDLTNADNWSGGGNLRFSNNVNFRSNSSGNGNFNLGTVEFRGAGTSTLLDSLSTSGGVLVQNGTLDTNDLNVTAGSGLTVTDATFSGKTGTHTLGGLSVTGTGNFDPGTGTTILTGGTVDILATETFNNLTINSTGAVTIAAGDVLNVPGTLTLTDGSINTGSITASGAITHSAGFDGGSGTLTISGGAGARNITLVTDGNLPNVVLNDAQATLLGADDGNGSNPATLASLTLQAGTVTQRTSEIEITGDYNQSGGTFTGGSGGTLDVDGNFSLSNGNFTPPSLVVVDGVSADGSIEVAGNLTISGGTYTKNSEVWVATGGALQVFDFNGNSINTLASNKAAGALRIAAGALDIDDDLIFLGGGSFDLDTNDNAVTIGGDILWDSANGMTIDRGASTITLDGTGTSLLSLDNQNIGNLIISGTNKTVSLTDVDLFGLGFWTADGNSQVNTLTLSGATDGININGNNLTVNTAFNNNGTFTLAGNETLSITGGMDNDSGTVVYNGTGNYTGGTGLAAGDTYNNLTFSGTGSWDADAALTVNNNLTLSNGSMDMSGENGTVGGNLAVSTGTFDIGTGNLGVTGNTDITGSGTLRVENSVGSGLTTTNLSVANGSTLFTTDNAKISLSGNWSQLGTYTNGFFALVTFTGAGNQTLDPGPNGNMSHFTHAGAGDLQIINNDITVNGNINNSAGAGALDVSDIDNITFYWSLDNDATITPGTATWSYGGSGNNNISLNGSSLYAFEADSTGSITLQDAMTLTDDLTVAAGGFDADSFNLTVGDDFIMNNNGTFTAPDNNATFTVSGNFQVSSGTFNHSSGKVVLDTAGTSILDAPAGGLNFWDLETTAAGKTLRFTAGDTFNILSPNTWTVTGAAGNLITLESTVPGTAWNVNPAGTNISYVSVSDSVNTSATLIDPANSQNAGRNVNWFTVTDPVDTPANPPIDEITDPTTKNNPDPLPEPEPDPEANPEPAGEIDPPAWDDPKPGDDGVPDETYVIVREGIVNVGGVDVYSGEAIMVEKDKMPAMHAKLAYVTTGDGVSVLRVPTNTTHKQIPSLKNISNIAVHPEKRRAYATQSDKQNLVVVDSIQLRPTKYVNDFGEAPNNLILSRDKSKAYVADYKSDTILVMNTNSNQVQRKIQTGSAPYGLATSKDDKFLYVTNHLDKTIQMIDIASGEEVKAIKGPELPYDLALSKDGKDIYVTDAMSSRVFVYRSDTLELRGTIEVGKKPHSIRMNPDGESGFITNREDNSVSRISLSEMKETSRIQVGTRPTGLDVTPDGKKLYVANQLSDSVSIIDLGENEVIKNIQTGTAPSSVAVSFPGYKEIHRK